MIRASRGRVLLTLALLSTAATLAVTAEPATTAQRTYTGMIAYRIEGGAPERVVKASVFDTTTTTGTTSEATMVVLPTASSPILAWLAPVIAGTANPWKSVDLLRSDGSGKVVEVEALPQASIASFRFPELDAASKEPVGWELKLTPTASTRAPATGAAVYAPTSLGRLVYANAFRLRIDGTDCSRVLKVSSILVTPRLAPGATAPLGTARVVPTIAPTITAAPRLTGDRLAEPLPPRVSASNVVSNLVFYVDPQTASSFTAWLTGGAEPRKGSLDYAHADMSVRCSARFSNLVVRSMSNEPGRTRVEASIGGLAFACN